ncbi:hypothetical protein BZARG_2842 [Bizionia argentinensis JUB59]|uniref:Uncharacterized protein n=1 Tax=Bizionia argentinensis JUB59 TaxID=1046627 RepID=G2EDB0_9FLAO|nr:hypothetical protein [Bizionia argentinensis]EGV43551.2 hypothetical protein BZARG_2842 [Bizionia argentinensis JUB59]
MKIKYNEIDKSIEIKDGVKTHYFVMKFLMVLNLLNAVLRILNINKTGIGFQEIIWFVLGFASLIILYLFVFKRTTLEKIPIGEIKELNEKSIFGRNRFSIKLLNGKKRDLTELKTQAEFKELKKMFEDIRIAE